MKEIEGYVYLYNMLGLLTSLSIYINFMKNMSSKFNRNLLNSVTLASFSLENTLTITEIEQMLISYTITKMVLREV